jgi:hypothetical protein
MNMQERRELCRQVEKWDTAVQGWYTQALQKMSHLVPPTEPREQHIAATTAAATTVSIEWLAFMLSFAYTEGALGSQIPVEDLIDQLRGKSA